MFRDASLSSELSAANVQTLSELYGTMLEECKRNAREHIKNAKIPAHRIRSLLKHELAHVVLESEYSSILDSLERSFDSAPSLPVPKLPISGAASSSSLSDGDGRTAVAASQQVGSSRIASSSEGAADEGSAVEFSAAASQSSHPMFGQKQKGVFIGQEIPFLLSKLTELFMAELTTRAFVHATNEKRRTIQGSDMVNAVFQTDIFDFLIDYVPRDAIPHHKRIDHSSSSSSASSSASSSFASSSSSLSSSSEVQNGSGSAGTESSHSHGMGGIGGAGGPSSLMGAPQDDDEWDWLAIVQAAKGIISQPTPQSHWASVLLGASGSDRAPEAPFQKVQFLPPKGVKRPLPIDMVVDDLVHLEHSALNRPLQWQQHNPRHHPK
eukprot:ANDGO_06958.mRNA.1 Nuclear transcription factor Y subunit C-1